MIPIENSLGGRVADMHHLLPESSLYIVNEHFQAVRHCLLAPAGATLEGLERIESHTQALTQCRGLIRELGVEVVHTADTAGAARDVAQRGDPKVAAIASSLAGEIYSLETLRTRIEDRLGNTQAVERAMAEMLSRLEVHSPHLELAECIRQAVELGQKGIDPPTSDTQTATLDELAGSGRPESETDHYGVPVEEALRELDDDVIPNPEEDISQYRVARLEAGATAETRANQEP